MKRRYMPQNSRHRVVRREVRHDGEVLPRGVPGLRPQAGFVSTAVRRDGTESLVPPNMYHSYRGRCVSVMVLNRCLSQPVG
jgi:hypothetical protein